MKRYFRRLASGNRVHPYDLPPPPNTFRRPVSSPTPSSVAILYRPSPAYQWSNGSSSSRRHASRRPVSDPAASAAGRYGWISASFDNGRNPAATINMRDQFGVMRRQQQTLVPDNKGVALDPQDLVVTVEPSGGVAEGTAGTGNGNGSGTDLGTDRPAARAVDPDDLDGWLDVKRCITKGCQGLLMLIAFAIYILFIFIIIRHYAYSKEP